MSRVLCQLSYTALIASLAAAQGTCAAGARSAVSLAALARRSHVSPGQTPLTASLAAAQGTCAAGARSAVSLAALARRSHVSRTSPCSLRSLGVTGLTRLASPLTDLNRRPLPYHGSALPTELRGRKAHRIATSAAALPCRTGMDERSGALVV